MALINLKNISTSAFDADALTTSTSNEFILNFGNLTTTGDLANGIFGDADGVTVSNFGRIETYGLGAAGIYVEGANAHVDNFGNIITHGDFYDPDHSVAPDGDEVYPNGISVDGDNFGIANYGTIRVEAGFQLVDGGFKAAFASGLDGQGADGHLINVGQIESTSDFGAMMIATGDRSQALNTGQLVGVGLGIEAMAVNGSDVAAVNRGVITLTGANDGGMIAQFPDGQLTNQGTIRMTGDDTWGMVGSGNDAHVDNFGHIETHGVDAIGIEGNGSLFDPVAANIDLVNSGHIATEGEGSIGVALGLALPDLDCAGGAASDSSIVNTGTIDTSGDGAAGALMVGDRDHLTNSGRITTDGTAGEEDGFGLLHAAGVSVSGDAALVENTSSGVIQSKNAASAAVELNVVERDGVSNADTSSLLENFGLIKGASVAVLGGAGAETVVNHGQIVGDVMLGGGNDTFVFGQGGRVVGDVYLGDGNNHVVVEKGSGVSHIADLSAGDVVDVSAFFSTSKQLMDHIQQHGSDVVVTLDYNDSLVLEHTQLTSLHLQDVFVV